jgi:riboflavin biosynthesis pyrimidine reductase
VNSRVLANLIIGLDGSTTLNHRSAGLSFPQDRLRFHALRKESDVILIGGNSARNEPYAITPLPLIVLSHTDQLPKEIIANTQVVLWNKNIFDAISDAKKTYKHILVEAGPSLLGPALRAGLIDELHICISNISGGESQISLKDFTTGYTQIKREEVEGGAFITYSPAPTE